MSKLPPLLPLTQATSPGLIERRKGDNDGAKWDMILVEYYPFHLAHGFGRTRGGIGLIQLRIYISLKPPDMHDKTTKLLGERFFETELF